MPDLNFSSDKAARDHTHDALNRAPFAKHLAESLLKMSPTDGFVVALYGPWGSGKTELLGYVVSYIEEAGEKYPESQQPIIMSFNPWWFSGQEALVRHFFSQLQAHFDKKDVTLKALRKGLGKLANVASKIPGAEIASIFEDVVTPKEPDVSKLKEQIAEQLQELKRRIFIVIDDIDRLPADEMGEIFRIIKGVADLPNIIYLLAFDRERAGEALEKSLGLPGEDFLEKIVQLPFDLPLPDWDLLKNLLVTQLNDMFDDLPSELFTPTYFGGFPMASAAYTEFTAALNHFIKTPRDVVRLTNVLKATYPAVKNEVHLVDFIGVEMLRLFCPPIYDKVRRNQSRFTGEFERFSLGDSGANSPFPQAWLDKTQPEDQDAVMNLLAYLFPKVMALRGGPKSVNVMELRRERRVASREIFPVYFQFTLPAGQLSSEEVREYLSFANDQEAFTNVLNSLITRHDDQINQFLDRLTDYKEEKAFQDNLGVIVAALLNVGDILAYQGELRPGHFIINLLSRLDERARYEILEIAVKDGKSLIGVTGIVAVLGLGFGKFGAEQPLRRDMQYVTSEQLKNLEVFALNRIREAATKTLISVPNLSAIILAWQDWAGNATEATNWLNDLIRTDQGLLNLISQSMLLAPDSKTIQRFPYERYQSLLNFDQIAERLKVLVKTEKLSSSQSDSVVRFLSDYRRVSGRI